jgi:hypothetical protein
MGLDFGPKAISISKMKLLSGKSGIEPRKTLSGLNTSNTVVTIFTG